MNKINIVSSCLLSKIGNEGRPFVMLINKHKYDYIGAEQYFLRILTTKNYFKEISK